MTSRNLAPLNAALNALEQLITEARSAAEAAAIHATIDPLWEAMGGRFEQMDGCHRALRLARQALAERPDTPARGAAFDSSDSRGNSRWVGLDPAAEGCAAGRLDAATHHESFDRQGRPCVMTVPE